MKLKVIDEVLTLGDRIREIRESLGISQKELLHRMGGANSRANISRIEGGTRRPSIAYCEKLADGLGITVRDLFSREALIEDPFIKEIQYYLRTLSFEQWEQIISLLRGMAPRK